MEERLPLWVIELDPDESTWAQAQNVETLGELDWPNPEWRFELYAWDAREQARQFAEAALAE